MTSLRFSGLFTAAIATALVLLMLAAGCTGTESTPAQGGGQTITVTDGFGRTVTVPSSPEGVVCSGSGCLRYLVYAGPGSRRRCR